MKSVVNDILWKPQIIKTFVGEFKAKSMINLNFYQALGGSIEIPAYIT